MSVSVPDLPVPALGESKVSVLDRLPQVPVLVALVICSFTEPAVAASYSLSLHDALPILAVPVTAQLEAVVLAVSTCHRKPVAGRLSTMHTWWASTAAVLVTVIV